MANNNLSLEERFLQKVRKTSECWEWEGAKLAGKPVMRVGGRLVPAYRVSYEIFTQKEVTESLYRICMNHNCVNPQHIKPKSQLTEEYFIQAMGGKYKGKESRFTEAEMDHMVSMKESGMTYAKIGESLGISPSTVRVTILARLEGKTFETLSRVLSREQIELAAERKKSFAQYAKDFQVSPGAVKLAVMRLEFQLKKNQVSEKKKRALP